ncbi:uncharacterized protein F4812DRAFT_468481 [Daldinia caldariorum]|uniref:uncharacterized protein n=1 Tax=Daldinia caldariorum TaxID=326644 RepID=UPI002008321E|nr:uncharacterized protein F4812DRAFT_468481 [Daldinia caldariorum]KAI1463846.1 hypothetical protein F4812DRAFT_468481 [Daldinia caldariorum]
MSNPPPSSTPSFSPTHTPTAYPWPVEKGVSERSQDTRASCQFITFYHTCGCRSYKDSVYLCSIGACQHTRSTVVLGELPFACGSYPGRSAACGTEDPAKREFVREVDTADRLEKLLVLPDCTRADIDDLIPPFHNPNWDYEISSRYHGRPSQSSSCFLPQVPPNNDRSINERDLGVQEVVHMLLSKCETAEEEHKESMVERYVEEQQQLNCQQLQNMPIDKNGQEISDISPVRHIWGDIWDAVGSESKRQHDAACYDAAYHDEKPADAVMFSSEDNTKDSPYSPRIGYINSATVVKGSDSTYYEQQPQGDNHADDIPKLESFNTRKYSEEGFGESDEVTDDFIDFLAEKDKKLQEGNPMMKKFWSYIRGY